MERKGYRSIINMEEVREAALAYYHNLPKDRKKLASAKFKEIDSDGSGTINMKEFKKSMGDSFDNNSKIMERGFKELDNNGDGRLDFNEYITLYYLVESGRVEVYCAGSGCEAEPFLKGLYFTCVDCFNNNKVETFDLCTSCYRHREYRHDHTNFVDNHVLLRSKAACCGSTFEKPVYEALSSMKSGVSVASTVGNVAADAANPNIELTGFNFAIGLFVFMFYFYFGLLNL